MAKKIAKEIGTVVLEENDVQWKCHDCDDAASWTEAILCEPLMSGSFNVITATDPDDSFSQTWEVEYDRIIYRVTVEEKEAEIMLV